MAEKLHRHDVSRWLLVILFVLIAAWIILSSETFQGCVDQAHKTGTNNQTPESISAFGISPHLLKVCSGEFFRHNGEAITAFFTVVLAASTILLWRSTDALRTLAIAQSDDMKASISESARAASAMENVAASIESSAKSAAESVRLGKERSAQQMRAYLSVIIGTAVHQDRAAGLKFEAQPTILNNGQTPAYNVRYRARAEILTHFVAKDFVFSVPTEPPASQSSIGPHENRMMSAIVEDFIADNEIPDVMTGNGKALWVWGIVRYDDIFGEPHFTEFSQQLTWLNDGTIWGRYSDRFSRSD